MALVICAGLMRTSSVAMWQVMREIVIYGGGDAPLMGTYDHADIPAMNYKNKNSLVKLHRPHEVLDGIVPIKAVMTIRDYRDVTFSLMKFRNDTFDGVVNHSRAFVGNIDAFYEWKEQVPDLLIVKYSQFFNRRLATIEQVAEFLDISIPYMKLREIDRKWSLDSNRRRSNQNHNIRSVEYMSKRHIHNGSPNQWMKNLSEDQILEIESKPKVRKWLVENGYVLYSDAKRRGVL